MSLRAYRFTGLKKNQGIDHPPFALGRRANTLMSMKKSDKGFVPMG
jgi:hypothetical protein